MAEHQHASILRAIADGVPLSEFEIHGKEWESDNWLSLDPYSSLVFSNDHEIRRKPQHIMVNGFKVPKPLDVMPDDEYVYSQFLNAEHYCDADNVESALAVRALKRGIAHATKEAAIAHAKAVLGIDPEAA